MKINPRYNQVWGFETPACLEMVISLMIGFMEGDKIPPVGVYTFDDGESYHIPYLHGPQEGGHHRSLAAYLSDSDLEIEVLAKGKDGYREPIPEGMELNVGLIEIEPSPETFVFNRSWLSKEYRELPCAEEFFSRYKDVNAALKHGTDIDYSVDRAKYWQILAGIESARKEFILKIQR